MATETVQQSDGQPSFSDTRVILMRGMEEDLAMFWDETEAGFQQSHDGPTHLVIGSLAPDEKLERIAKRPSYSFDELKAFRDNAEPVPSELHERFLPQEDPTFHLLRRCGDVRLWSSTTTRHDAFGHTRLSVNHYHITEGEKIAINHMPDLEHALPNFEMTCQQSV